MTDETHAESGKDLLYKYLYVCVCVSVRPANEGEQRVLVLVWNWDLVWVLDFGFEFGTANRLPSRLHSTSIVRPLLQIKPE